MKIILMAFACIFTLLGAASESSSSTTERVICRFGLPDAAGTKRIFIASGAPKDAFWLDPVADKIAGKDYDAAGFAEVVYAALCSLLRASAWMGEEEAVIHLAGTVFPNTAIDFTNKVSEYLSTSDPEDLRLIRDALNLGVVALNKRFPPTVE